MTDEQEGLPPPPRPAPPQPAGPPRTPEIKADAVRGSLDRTLELSSQTTARWNDALGNRAQVEASARFAPFSASGADPLQEVRSLFEDAVVGETPDPSTLGILRAIGGGIATGISQPIAAITDEYQVGQVRELQQKFLKTHGPALKELSENLGLAKRAMRELADLMPPNISTAKLDDLMRQKRLAGNRTMSNIEHALAHATDPHERARLQALKDDLGIWMAERDARIAREHAPVAELGVSIRMLDQQMFLQKSALEKAAWSESPSTTTSGGEVVGTTHTRTDAVRYATSLHDMLLGYRVGISRALAGE